MDRTGHHSRFVVNEKDLRESFMLRVSSSNISQCSSVSFDFAEEDEDLEYESEFEEKETCVEGATKASLVRDRWNDGEARISRLPISPKPQRQIALRRGRSDETDAEYTTQSMDTEEFTYVTIDSSSSATSSSRISVRESKENEERGMEEIEIEEEYEEYSVALNDDEAKIRCNVTSAPSYESADDQNSSACEYEIIHDDQCDESIVSVVSALTTPSIPFDTPMPTAEEERIRRQQSTSTDQPKCKEAGEELHSSFGSGSVYSGSLAGGSVKAKSDEESPPPPPPKRISRIKTPNSRDRSDSKRLVQIGKAKLRRAAMMERRNQRVAAQEQQSADDSSSNSHSARWKEESSLRSLVTTEQEQKPSEDHNVSNTSPTRLKRDLSLRRLAERMKSTFGSPTISPRSLSISPGSIRRKYVDKSMSRRGVKRQERQAAESLSGMSPSLIRLRKRRLSLENKRDELQKAFDNLCQNESLER